MTVSKTEYNRIHQWLHRHHKKKRVCETCGNKGFTEWSTKTGQYKQVREEYQELCKSCHTKYDIRVLGRIPFGGKRGRRSRTYLLINGIRY